MQRKDLSPHVLRSVRALYGLSQARLGALVGVQAISIKQVESGKLKVSPSFAQRVYMATGLAPNQLTENFDPETPRGVSGAPLGPDDFKRIREIHRSSETKKNIDADIRFYSEILTLILDASIRESKLWALRWPTLKNAFVKLIDDFTLGDDVRTLFLERWGNRERLLREWGTEKRLLERWTVEELWAPDGLYIQANAQLCEPERIAANAARARFYDQKEAKTPARKKRAKSSARKF